MTLRYIPSILIVASLCVVGGCEDKKPAPAAPVASATKPLSVNSAKRKPPQRGRPRGFGAARFGPRRHTETAGALLRASMKAPNLTDEQKKKLEAMMPKRGERRAAPDEGGVDKVEFRKSMVEAIKAGKIDAKAYDKHVAAMTKAREERSAKRAKLLQDLHALLTPEQRKAVAATVREQLEERAERRKSAEERGRPGAGAKGKRLPGPLGLGLKGPGRGLHLMDRARGMRNRGSKRLGFPFESMSSKLDLTAEQKKKLDALMKKVKESRPSAEDREARREEARKRMVTLLDAFEKDSFDASKLGLDKKDDKAGAWMKRQAENFSAFLAILTEEQRAKLAQRFERPTMQLPEAPTAELDEMLDTVEDETPSPADTPKPEPKASVEPAKAPAAASK